MATSTATPKGKASKQTVETRSRKDVNWDLYPSLLAKVH